MQHQTREPCEVPCNRAESHGKDTGASGFSLAPCFALLKWTRLFLCNHASEMEPLFCEDIINLPSVLLCLFLPMSPPDQAFSTDILGTNAPFQKNILQAKKSHASCIFQDATQSTLRIALPAEKESHDYSLSSFRWSSRFFSPSCSSLGGMQSDAATAHDSNGTLARNKRERERERGTLSILSL